MKHYAALISFFIIASLCFLENCSVDRIGPEPTDCDYANTFTALGQSDEVKAFISATSPKPVFVTADTIPVPAYVFDDFENRSKGGEVFSEISKNKNDFCNYLRLLDRWPLQPELQWTFVQNELVVAAIFDEPIEMFQGGSSIKNSDHVVWTWNSKMGTGKQFAGKQHVKYSDGKKSVDGKIVNDPLEDLKPGKMYQWAVWAWNSDGTEVVLSTAAIPFITRPQEIKLGNVTWFTQPRPLQSGNPSSGQAKWMLTSAIRVSDSANVYSDFLPKTLTISDKGICNSAIVTTEMQASDTLKLGSGNLVEFKKLPIRSGSIEWICEDVFEAKVMANGFSSDIYVVYEKVN